MADPVLQLFLSLTTTPFVAPSWTDVSAWFVSFDSKMGRQYEINENETGTATIVVDNTDGRFTAGRALLANGVTANPYYPNCTVDRMVRLQATYGGQTFYLFTGYVTGFTPVNVGIAYAEMELACVDAFNYFGLAPSVDPYQAKVLADGACSYHPLSETADSRNAGDVSTGVVPPLTIYTRGAGTATLGADTGAANGQTGLSMSQPSSASPSGMIGYGLPPANVVAFWVTTTSTQPATLFQDDNNGGPWLTMNADGTVQARAASTVPINDGKPHFIVYETRLSIWVDGVNYVASGIHIGEDTTSPATVQVGFGLAGTAFNGTIWGLARWLRSNLPADYQASGDLTPHVNQWYQAGKMWPGEDEVTRITRYLQSSPIAVTAPLVADASVSSLGADISVGNLLQQLQGASDDASGNLFIDGQGNTRYQNRRRRYNATPVVTFAEEQGKGVETSTPAYDNQLVVDQVEVTRVGGAVQSVASVATPLHPMQVTLNVTSDAEALDAANWRLALYENPHWRIDSVTISPAAQANGALWPLVLGRLPSDQISLTDPFAAVGSTATLPFFIENIATNIQADGGTNNWTITYGLSAGSQVPPVLTLDNATFGHMDTDALAY